MTIYGRSEQLVSRCIECDLAEPESLASLGGSAPGLVDGILSLNELMSMNILYPGLLGTCFSFFFGTLACVIFACAHISHGSSFPVSFTPMYSAVGLNRCSPVRPVIGGISRLACSCLVQSPHVLDPPVSVFLFPLAMMTLMVSFYQTSYWFLMF